MEENGEVYLTVEEVAHTLRYSKRHIIRRAKEGRIPAAKDKRGHLVIPKRELMEFVQSRTSPPGSKVSAITFPSERLAQLQSLEAELAAETGN